MELNVSDDTFSIICLGVVTLMVAAVYVLTKYAK